MRGLRISATTLEVDATRRANQVLRIVGAAGNKERLVPLPRPILDELGTHRNRRCCPHIGAPSSDILNCCTAAPGGQVWRCEAMRLPRCSPAFLCQSQLPWRQHRLGKLASGLNAAGQRCSLDITGGDRCRNACIVGPRSAIEKQGAYMNPLLPTGDNKYCFTSAVSPDSHGSCRRSVAAQIYVNKGLELTY